MDFLCYNLSMIKKFAKFILLLMLIGITFFASTSVADNDGEWYPFFFPEKLDFNSPLNIGKLVLDAPAGKHGFVKVKDGHFFFEDGTRAKFWGTNLCFNACFPNHEQAEILADRIAFFGFNAVRLHHMDFFFEPKGIFEDIQLAYKNPQMKKTGKLSKNQLDKLDYLIYQLKQRGIYVDINLLVSRHFTEADGVREAEMLGIAAKPYSMFDRKLIELQKKYASDLLTHRNPYTKLRYHEDPAVAMIEIINESSLKKFSPEKYPKYYQKQLDVLGKGYPDDIEKKYFDEMVGFLKNEIGVKCPISGSQYSSTDALSSCDFIDKHAYWDHPKFPREKWEKNDFTIHNKSVLLDKKLGITNYLVNTYRKAAKQYKPFAVTEWNQCYPNQFAYETPIILSVEASMYNWDGLFQFAFSHGWKQEPVFDDIQSYFDTIANPQKLILTSLGGLMFLKGESITGELKDGIFTVTSPSLDAAVGFIKDKSIALGPFTITTDQNGAIALLKDGESYILFAISDVKNTGSGWNVEGKFNWGKHPVLLKRINATVKIDDKTISSNLSKTPWVEIKP